MSPLHGICKLLCCIRLNSWMRVTIYYSEHCMCIHALMSIKHGSKHPCRLYDNHATLWCACVHLSGHSTYHTELRQRSSHHYHHQWLWSSLHRQRCRTDVSSLVCWSVCDNIVYQSDVTYQSHGVHVCTACMCDVTSMPFMSSVGLYVRCLPMKIHAVLVCLLLCGWIDALSSVW